MELYNRFIGIDIGKYQFVVAIHGEKSTREYDNTREGVHQFLKDYKTKVSHTFVVLEATGGYERLLLLTLCQRGTAVHRANTRKVKNFIRSFGNPAKTDHLDAKALAFYGAERGSTLEIFKPVSDKALELFELTQRRKDLMQMLVAEKNRRQAPTLKHVKTSIDVMIRALTSEVSSIDERVSALISADEALSTRRQILQSIPGIGQVVASSLLALMPELGHMNRRQAASLAGLAPQANDSGKSKGYRRVAPGRNQMKPLLFMAAMAARRSNSRLKDFYEDLIARGKNKMVALVALMRKLIVIANARLKEAAV